MMKLIAKISTVAATIGLLGVLVAPVAIAAPNTIDLNGAFSRNIIRDNSNCAVWLKQKTKTNVTTVVAQKGKTGLNSNTFNTGGTVSTTTGGVTNGTGVTAISGSNDGTIIDPCCLCQESGENSITSNGAFSYNKIVNNNDSVVGVSQKNTMDVVTVVNQTGTTGGNSNSFNTGSGSTIDTGTVDNTTEVLVSGGSNTASL